MVSRVQISGSIEARWEETNCRLEGGGEEVKKLGDPETMDGRYARFLCAGGIPSGKSTVSGMSAWRLSRNRLSTICDRNL